MALKNTPDTSKAQTTLIMEYIKRAYPEIKAILIGHHPMTAPVVKFRDGCVFTLDLDPNKSKNYKLPKIEKVLKDVIDHHREVCPNAKDIE